jgi:Phasin protein
VAEDEKRAESPLTPMLPKFMFSEAMGSKNLEAFAAAQKRFFEALEQANRDWLDRLNEGAALTSDFTRKVSAARSIPDAAAGYQEWANQQMALVSRQTQKFMEDSQKFMNACVKIAGNGKGLTGT